MKETARQIDSCITVPKIAESLDFSKTKYSFTYAWLSLSPQHFLTQVHPESSYGIGGTSFDSKRPSDGQARVIESSTDATFIVQQGRLHEAHIDASICQNEPPFPRAIA